MSATAFINLGSATSSHVSGVLAQMKDEQATSQKPSADYNFSSIGAKRHSEIASGVAKRKKAKNVTPGVNRPYCRHKDF